MTFWLGGTRNYSSSHLIKKQVVGSVTESARQNLANALGPQLGYTYDWGQPSNLIVDLSEFVIPNWRAWPSGTKSVPIEVVTVIDAATHGR